MPMSAPSPLFERLVSVWRGLALRSDTDDIILELLGRFSLEKVYASGVDPDGYLQLVTALVVKLDAVFYVQRLSLPTDNVHASRYLGLLVSWEVTARTVDYILQTLLEARHILAEEGPLRDKHLPSFLLGALRVLTLHPRQPTGQRGTKDRRDRYARIQSAMEHVVDSYSGPRSFVMEVAREVTAQLLAGDASAVGLPPGLKYGLPSLATDMRPLADCLQPAYISELALPGERAVSWLAQFLALRDVTHFVVGAWVQHAAHSESPDVRLQTDSVAARNAVLAALDNLRLPMNLSRSEMVSIFAADFRSILPDTGLHGWETHGPGPNDEDLDALEALAIRLTERQVVHRASDQVLMHGISQVWTSIQEQDGLHSKSPPTWPALFVVNCPDACIIGGTQFRKAGLHLPDSSGSELRLATPISCPACGRHVTVVREITLARETWKTLRPLEPETDTINVERHLATHFDVYPRPETNSYFANYTGFSRASHEDEGYGDQKRPRPPPTPERRPGSIGFLGPPSPDSRQFSSTPSSSRSGPGSLGSLPSVHTRVHRPIEFEPAVCSPQAVEPTAAFPLPPPTPASEMITPSQPSPSFPLDIRRPSSPKRPPAAMPIVESPVVELAPPWQVSTISSPESKPKMNGWKAKFTGRRKPSISAATADSSSLSELGAESQRLEEINLSGLLGGHKSKSKGGRTVKAVLSQHANSTLALFWSPLVIYVWDIAPSPPALKKSITTENTCIIATVSLQYLAYVVGTRDAKLTLRIVDLAQSGHPGIEYRIPSTQWCRSIAIDQQESYVVLGFDNSMVRWFKTSEPSQVREDRLHPRHKDCKACPPVDTLSFSHDGLALVASTRQPKTGVIQVYRWKWPFSAVEELKKCQYAVPLHESEDNGVSSVLFRSASEPESDLVCITTWTQSGGPLLVQPDDGHRSEIKSDMSGKHTNKLGHRIQSAAFSPSGRQLILVNEKGHLYEVSSLNKHPLDVRRIATSKELTAKSEAFSLAFMTLPDEECVVLAWADAGKMTAWIKKIPVAYQISNPPTLPALVRSPTTPEESEQIEAPPAKVAELEYIAPPVELPATPSQGVFGKAPPLKKPTAPTPFEGKW